MCICGHELSEHANCCGCLSADDGASDECPCDGYQPMP